MPYVRDCPVCYPESPFRDSHPWKLWEHRRLSELFTRKGRARWEERRQGILATHRRAGHTAVV